MMVAIYITFIQPVTWLGLCNYKRNSLQGFHLYHFVFIQFFMLTVYLAFTEVHPDVNYMFYL